MGVRGGGKSSLGLVGLAAGEAVMELAEEAVVQVAQCGRVAVAYRLGGGRSGLAPAVRR